MIRRIGVLVALVVVANSVILWSVYDNRRGEPDAVVTLTEREWSLASVSERNSARELNWTTARYAYWQGTPWLDAAKLAALGFDTSMPLSAEKADAFYGQQLPPRVFAVFEFDGDSWQKALEERRNAAADQPQRDANLARATADQVESERIRGARLVPVDAGLDPDALRRAYPDRSRFIIVPAVVNIHVGFGRRTPPAAAPRVLGGSVRAVTTTLVVPREFRAALERAESRPSDRGAPRYSVTIAYGHRHEPWIVAIQPIDTPAVR
jgi:Domain of unknown function (DUF4824)